MDDYLKAIRSFATDSGFRSEFRANPAATLQRRGLKLGEEQLAALSDVASDDDVQPSNAQGRVARWFQYVDLTPSALGVT